MADPWEWILLPVMQAAPVMGMYDARGNRDRDGFTGGFSKGCVVGEGWLAWARHH